MGVMLDTFQSSGTLPDSRELLNRVVRYVLIEGAVFLSMVAEIPSGPVATSDLMEDSSFAMSDQLRRGLGCWGLVEMSQPCQRSPR